jgi:hypothetical protein
VNACQIARQFSIEVEYAEELLSNFTKGVGKEASLAPWFYQYGEAGEFSVRSRRELILEYVETRLCGEDVDYLLEYRPAKSFREAKKEIVSFFVDWKAQINGALQLSRRIKCPKKLKK